MGTDLQELDSRISEEEKKVKTCQTLSKISLLDSFTCFNAWTDCDIIILESLESQSHGSHSQILLGVELKFFRGASISCIYVGGQ